MVGEKTDKICIEIHRTNIYSMVYSGPREDIRAGEVVIGQHQLLA